MTGRVLVTGATGNTGRPLVEMLRAQGVPVRAMVRSSATAPRFGDGVEEAVADFDDATSIAAALAGVEQAYLVTPSSERAQAQQEQFVDLAAKCGVRHVVKLSQFAAAADSPVRFLRYHAAVEQRLRDSGSEYTMLQPNLYFQGLLAMAGVVREHGRLVAPLGDAQVSAVDVRDIAAVAAVALTQPGHAGKSYPITGPAAVTHAEMADALSAATGKSITFQDVPEAEFAAMLRDALPAWQVEGLLEDYAHYARGEAASVAPTVLELTGRPARPFGEFAREHADAFR